MTAQAIAEPRTPTPDGGAATAVLDIVIVFAVSAAAYLAEGWARDTGVLTLGEDSRGVIAVLAGAATALALLFARGGSLRDIGLRSPRRWATVPLWVVGIVVAFLAVNNGVPALLSLFVELPPPDLSRHNPIAGDARAALVMALVLPFTASIPEEIIYRGFLMERLTRIFGAGRSGAFFSVAVQSLLFGAAHIAWGPGGIVMAVMMGAVWGTAFLLCGRNLWVVILAHSLVHLLMVAQLYSSPPS